MQAFATSRIFRIVTMALTAGFATAPLGVAGAQTSGGSPRGARFVEAPRTVARGERLTVAVTGLRSYKDVGETARSFRYRLTVDQVQGDRKPNRACVRDVDTSFPAGSSTATLTWKGKFPTTLRCYDRHSHFLGSLAIKPGSYRLVVGVKVGKGAWDSRGSVLVRRVVVRR